MKDIEIGQEYAYSCGLGYVKRVRVIEKRLKYGRAKGRGVKVEFWENGFRGRASIVYMGTLFCSWAEWTKRMEQFDQRCPVRP